MSLFCTYVRTLSTHVSSELWDGGFVCIHACIAHGAGGNKVHDLYLHRLDRPI